MDQPRGADYLEALQHPSEAFADPDLAGGSVELTPLGLPRVRSGNVAGVFKVTGASGRAYAVRCFVRRFDDLAIRYAALTGRLAKTPATWKVGVEYQAQGVRVDDEWFPIVKMEWSESVPLLSWIEAHVWDADAVAYLAARFVSLVESLRAAGIAHGDLQHGNILVAPGGDLRLVDYDGMYVPELARLPLRSNELGHRNYSHPLRTRDDFDPHLDGFASWVVYASLAALSIDPLLWGRLDGGDECLLFRAHDFADPARSEAFPVLRASGDPRLCALADAVEAQLARRPDDVVPLSFATAPPPALAGSRPAAAGRQMLMEVLRAAAAPSSTGGSEAMDELQEERRAVDEDERRAGEAFSQAEADLRHREHVELQAVDQELRSVLSELSAREHELFQAEHHERAEALKAFQSEALHEELAKHRLVRARVAGLTEKVVYALALDDVRTAADVADVVVEKGVFVVRPDGRRVKVSALGPDEARALAAWRRALVSQCEPSLPQSLPSDRLASIAKAYGAQRDAIAEEVRTARAAAARRAHDVRAALDTERTRHLADLQAARQAAAARRVAIDRRLGRARKEAVEADFAAAPPRSA